MITMSKMPVPSYLLPALLVAPLFFLTACGGSDSTDTTPIDQTETDAGTGIQDEGDIDTTDAEESTNTEETTDTEGPVGPIEGGTIAESPEALVEFLFLDTWNFWDCSYSDGSENDYISLNGRDDEADPGFNPALLFARIRGPQLEGDPRALTPDEVDAEVVITSVNAQFEVLSADSVLVRLLAGAGFADGPSDVLVDLSSVRIGPGRFTADESLGNTQMSCTFVESFDPIFTIR